ncbi:hypothetical protein L2E82_27652 [Cichorium intybus]|uniref:Uncharacterized protein n=1 Tax=Cichorium intybus TaxID=13427 RepID=A0ACB9CTZ9_CICIN|nr:hypothetical protein L2E82_27652 [Cichorium intybus]
MPGPIVEDFQSEREVQHNEHPVIENVNEEDDHDDVDADSDDEHEEGAQVKHSFMIERCYLLKPHILAQFQKIPAKNVSKSGLKLLIRGNAAVFIDD